MPIPTTPPHDVRALVRSEDERLLALLRSLSPDDWRRPTSCPGWDVHALALHLLGGSFGVVSWLRDGHRGAHPPAGVDESGFIVWLDELQAQWVDAARRISPALTVELLAWSTARFDEALASQEPAAVTAHVSWASDAPVPVWVDHARELTEKWIHRQQLLQALHRPSDLRADLAAPVLDALRLAYPYRLGAHVRPAGAAVVIEITDTDVDLAGRWYVVSDGERWTFDGEHAAAAVVARMTITAEQSWRLLTNNLDPAVHGPVLVEGDPAIVATLLKTRAIIGAPKDGHA